MRMMTERSLVRSRAFVLAIVVLLAGCITAGNQLGKDARFTKADPAGVVVIGLNSVGVDPEYPGGAAYPGFLMLWSKVDKPLRHSREISARHTDAYFIAEMDLVAKDKKAIPSEGAQYVVLRVPPGTYQARTIENFALRGRGTDHSVFVMSDSQWLIEVGAGEVIYIGDFFADLSEQPARDVRYHRNDAAAARALAAYKGVEPQMVYRLPSTPRTRTPRPGT